MSTYKTQRILTVSPALREAYNVRTVRNMRDTVSAMLACSEQSLVAMESRFKTHGKPARMAIVEERITRLKIILEHLTILSEIVIN